MTPHSRQPNDELQALHKRHLIDLCALPHDAGDIDDGKCIRINKYLICENCLPPRFIRVTCKSIDSEHRVRVTRLTSDMCSSSSPDSVFDTLRIVYCECRIVVAVIRQALVNILKLHFTSTTSSLVYPSPCCRSVSVHSHFPPPFCNDWQRKFCPCVCAPCDRRRANNFPTDKSSRDQQSQTSVLHSLRKCLSFRWELLCVRYSTLTPPPPLSVALCHIRVSAVGTG